MGLLTDFESTRIAAADARKAYKDNGQALKERFPQSAWEGKVVRCGPYTVKPIM